MRAVIWVFRIAEIVIVLWSTAFIGVHRIAEIVIVLWFTAFIGVHRMLILRDVNYRMLIFHDEDLN